MSSDKTDPSQIGPIPDDASAEELRAMLQDRSDRLKEALHSGKRLYAERAELEGQLARLSEQDGQQQQSHQRDLVSMQSKLHEALTERETLNRRLAQLQDELAEQERRSSEYQRELNFAKTNSALRAEAANRTESPPGNPRGSAGEEYDALAATGGGNATGAGGEQSVASLKAQLVDANSQVQTTKATVRSLQAQRESERDQLQAQINELRQRQADTQAELERTKRQAAEERSRLRDELEEAKGDTVSLEGTLKRVSSERFPKLDFNRLRQQGGNDSDVSPMPSARPGTGGNGGGFMFASGDFTSAAGRLRRRGHGTDEDDEDEMLSGRGRRTSPDSNDALVEGTSPTSSKPRAMTAKSKANLKAAVLTVGFGLVIALVVKAVFLCNQCPATATAGNSGTSASTASSSGKRWGM